MTILFLGIDLTTNVFALHGVDRAGKAVLVRPAVRRDQLLETVAKLLPCTIGIQACSDAHQWAREFAKFGHAVKLMAPKFIRTFPRLTYLVNQWQIDALEFLGKSLRDLPRLDFALQTGMPS